MVKLVIVNENDQELGLEEKSKCHQVKGILHRAFTVFVFNAKKQLLIQKRSKNKLLWPLIWEGSCSSHPSRNESYIIAGKKRLKRELGFNCKLKPLTKFKYQARYKKIGSENEICTLLIGEYNGKVKPNEKEVSEWKWINLKELKKDLTKNPGNYAPWLKVALKRYENCK